MFFRELFNRPGVAGAVIQTPLLLIKLFADPFPPNLQNIINPKPFELGTSNFATMATVGNIVPMADGLGRPDQSARLISDW